MKKRVMFTNVSALLGLIAVLLLAGCGGGGKNLNNVLAPTDNNALQIFTESTAVEHTAAEIDASASDTAFIKDWVNDSGVVVQNIKSSGATYVGSKGTQCSTCHDATTPDIIANFTTTNHATAAQRKIALGSFTSNSCLNCHTVDGPQIPNWTGQTVAPTRTDVNNGAFGLVAVAYNLTATSTVQKAAAVAAPLGGIQCENCHGPASLHIAQGGAKTAIVRGSQALAVSTCDVCHDAPTHHVKSIEWRRSGHAVASHPTNSRCVACHNAEGFIEFTKRKAADPAVYAFDGKGTITQTKQLHNINCAACHDPHKTTPGNPQLRIVAEELCITCHKAGSSGSKVTVGSTSYYGVRGPGMVSGTSFSAPHHNIQGRILAGEYGMTVDDKIYIESSTDPILTATYTVTTKQVSPSSADWIGPSMGTTSCVNCHMYEADHTFNPNVKACENCHQGINGVSIVGTKQAAFRQKIGVIAGYDPTSVTPDAANLISGGVLDRYAKAKAAFDAGSLTTAQKVKFYDAKWNLELVIYDGSKGVHNTAYINKLIDNASDMLTTLGY